VQNIWTAAFFVTLFPVLVAIFLPLGLALWPLHLAIVLLFFNTHHGVGIRIVLASLAVLLWPLTLLISPILLYHRVYAGEKENADSFCVTKTLAGLFFLTIPLSIVFMPGTLMASDMLMGPLTLLILFGDDMD